MNSIVLKKLAESKKKAEFFCSVGCGVPIRGFIEDFSPDSDYVKVKGEDENKPSVFHLKKSHIILITE